MAEEVDHQEEVEEASVVEEEAVEEAAQGVSTHRIVITMLTI